MVADRDEHRSTTTSVVHGFLTRSPFVLHFIFRLDIHSQIVIFAALVCRPNESVILGIRSSQRSQPQAGHCTVRRMPERLSTGDKILDERLEGGLRAGSLLAVSVPPASQSEALLYTLMNERPTLYVSTVRRRDAVQRDLERTTEVGTDFEVVSAKEKLNMDSEMVKKITGERSLSSRLTTEQTTPLDEVYEHVTSLDRQMNVVCDPMNALERSGKVTKYQTVLNELKDRLMQTNGLGILHCIRRDDKPRLRETTLTIADIVWTLEHVSKSKEQKYYLTVSKNRGESVVREKIELYLGRTTRIDDTRNI